MNTDTGQGFFRRNVVTTEVRCGISLIDRIRILWTGKFSIYVKTFCENSPGRIDSVSLFWAERIFPNMKKYEHQAPRP